jgi:two-component system cell cycle response regulator
MSNTPPVMDSESSHTRRIVIVGGTEASDRLAGLIDNNGMRSKVVPSYLSALGEVSKRPADIVVGPVDVLHGSMNSVIRSLRTLSPGTRLVALGNQAGAELRHKADAAGFDDCLVGPIGLEALDRLMGIRRSQADTEPLQGSVSSGATQTISPIQTDASLEHSPSEELGDVDLVDSLLAGRGDLASVAVRLIASDSGLHGVGLLPADKVTPHGNASVCVTYQGRHLGQLHAPAPVTAEQLAPWADWLSKWLALGGQVAELRDMALRDELTGIWNRRYFNRFLNRILLRAANDRSQVTLLMFDIDDFKLYNDKYGHATGDEVLRETARMMRAVVRDHDVVARIGGDEFAVIFWDNEKPRKPNSEHPQDVVAAARRFQDAICSHRFPKLLDQAIGRLTVSGGLASFPWDGRTPSELLARADAMAMQSKLQGKNAITFGTGGKLPCSDE